LPKARSWLFAARIRARVVEQREKVVHGVEVIHVIWCRVPGKSQDREPTLLHLTELLHAERPPGENGHPL
jgi:hypothetical protein